ncbi:protein adenylyltransferase SelO-like isoform X2 [Periplaneta americana]|uniref:protein adenylyltransferase SelO-like isoform X2 n=1 Tax=Periplaneta americana TaxID=6978 RepID=UPI0037E977CC
MLFCNIFAVAVQAIRWIHPIYVTSERNYTRLMMERMGTDCSALIKDINEWHFAPSKLMTLPLDGTKENYIRRNVKEAIFSVVSPTPLATKLKLVSYSEDVLINILDMDPSISKTYDFSEFIAGNKILPSCTPLAHRYGGHQFGFWAMQLGDGRAHLLGEYVNRAGERWELQLKGSGKTPYSRDGDGHAVLRSSIREFLCSEAMYYLGVPTSRAAAIVVSQDPVLRDQFYNGYPRTERAAVVLRLAPSWFRFGSLEILAHNKEMTSLKKLIDFIISEHYPEIDLQSENKYLQLFSQVAQKTMDLVVQWQSIGFTHGVLNTDNMSMLGITIDYGPFGFMEAYDSRFVPNSSDKEARYCFERQFQIAEWNLEQLSQAIIPLLDESQTVEITGVLQNIIQDSQNKLRDAFRKKLGLRTDVNEIDNQLLTMLLQMMEETGADFTQTFRQLGDIPMADLRNPDEVKKHWSLQRLSNNKYFLTFVDAYEKRLAEDGTTDSERRRIMCKINPRYVLKNWMAQSAIEKAEKDDFSEVQFLLNVLQSPYTVNEEAEKRGYADPPPKWSSTIKVSCSS